MVRVMRVDVDVPDRDNFRTNLRILALPRIGIIDRRSTPSFVQHDLTLVRDGAGELVFNFASEGDSHWFWPKHEIRLSPSKRSLSPLTISAAFGHPTVAL